MNWICIGVACAAALCLYLASPHQVLWRGVPVPPAVLRWLSLLLAVAAVLLASAEYGFWCAVFIGLSGLMLALVALPCVDAWNRGRHVG